MVDPWLLRFNLQKSVEVGGEKRRQSFYAGVTHERILHDVAPCPALLEIVSNGLLDNSSDERYLKTIPAILRAI